MPDTKKAAPDAAPKTENTPLDYAGFAPRLVAYLVDLLVALAPVLLINWLLRAAIGDAMARPLLFYFTGGMLARAVLFAAYFALCTLLTGTTAGKRLLRLRVVDKSGAPAAKRDILYRETVGRLLTGFLCVGYIVLAVDRQHRGFHDMLCDTRVVYDDRH